MIGINFLLLLIQPSRKLRKKPNSNMENQNPRVPPLCEHSLTTLLGHDPTSDPGIALRQWVHFQGVHNILDLISWDTEELKAVPAQQVYSLDDHGQGLYLMTNQIKQMSWLITYMKHVFRAYSSDIDPRNDPFHLFTPDEWSQQTSTMLRTHLIQNLPGPHGPEPVPSGPISSSQPTGYSPAAIELMGFKKGIKREITAYPSLKDERYFDDFNRNMSKSKCWTLQSSLLMLWMEKTRVNNQTKIDDDENLLKLFDSTTKLAQIASTWGIQAGALNR